MKMLWGVKRAKQDKIGLMIVFSMGILVCTAGVIRLWALQKTSISTDPSCKFSYAPLNVYCKVRLANHANRGQCSIYHLVHHRVLCWGHLRFSSIPQASIQLCIKEGELKHPTFRRQ